MLMPARRFASLLAFGFLTLAPTAAFADPPIPGTGPSPFDPVTVERGVTPAPGFGSWISGVTSGGASGEGTTSEPGFAGWAAQIVVAITGITL